MSEILSLVDIIDQKLRKERELAFYEDQLKELEEKMAFLRKEISLTNFIIDAINNEKDGHAINNEKDGQLQKRLGYINEENK
jgi:hypothetical protein